MGINITHTMNNFQFEKREHLRDTAKRILKNQGADSESVQKIVEDTIFSKNSYENPQLSIIKASSQITMNSNLKETLKYLKSHANKKEKKDPILGELWDRLTNSVSESNYEGELLDFVIDANVENIFAA